MTTQNYLKKKEMLKEIRKQDGLKKQQKQGNQTADTVKEDVFSSSKQWKNIDQKINIPILTM